MKFYKKIFFLVLACFSCFNIYSQEEFFNNEVGISTVASTGINTFGEINLYSFGASVHSSKGFIFGLNLSDDTFDHKTISGLIGLIPNFGLKRNDFKPNIALLYGINDFFMVGGVNFGISKVIFSKSKFPASFNGGLGLQKIFVRNNYYYTQSDNTFSTLSIAYNQAFFANKRVYPFLGISNTFTLSGEKVSNFYIHLGLNMKMGLDE